MKKIVIIEDTKLDQQRIKEVVLELGYKIVGIFSYGEKAVDYILREDNNPDLIIIDIILEGTMDGYQVAEKIVAESDIPFIFISSKSDEIKDFKASFYLNKPFNKKELKNNIELALYKNEMHQKMLKSNEEKEMVQAGYPVVVLRSEAQVINIGLVQKDLNEIIAYIQHDNPDAALKFLDKIDKSISQLRQFPYKGTISDDDNLQSKNYRMLIIESYLVFYIINENQKEVEIRRIIHGKRKYDFLL